MTHQQEKHCGHECVCLVTSWSNEDGEILHDETPCLKNGCPHDTRTTSEPMYLITKLEMGEIIDITEEISDLDGWVKEALPLAKKRMEITNRVLSRPAQQPKQAARLEYEIQILQNLDAHLYKKQLEHDALIAEKAWNEVLDELIEWAKPIRKYWANNDCHRDPFDETIKKCESLRKKGR